jgi:CheY-like chemotaxis protein
MVCFTYEVLPELHGKCFFIIEDNVENRTVFQLLFMRYKVQVYFERWGRDVLFHMKNVPSIDLIILDLMLADGISGFKVYDDIRRTPQFASIPVLAVSAMEPAIAIPRAQAAGFSGFIAKPIDTYLFPQQVLAVLNGEQVWHYGDVG